MSALLSAAIQRLQAAVIRAPSGRLQAIDPTEWRAATHTVESAGLLHLALLGLWEPLGPDALARPHLWFQQQWPEGWAAPTRLFACDCAERTLGLMEGDIYLYRLCATHLEAARRHATGALSAAEMHATKGMSRKQEQDLRAVVYRAARCVLNVTQADPGNAARAVCTQAAGLLGGDEPRTQWVLLVERLVSARISTRS